VPRWVFPHTLAELGLDTSRAEEIGQKALVEASTACNPRAVMAVDLASILINAVKGRLS